MSAEPSASGPRPGALLGLGLCGAAALAVYAVGFSLAYPIEDGLARPLQHFGRLSGPSTGATTRFILAVGALFALYLAALRICLRLEGSRGGLAVVGTFGLLSALALLPMYPIFSLDVFYYMAADRIWSFYHENPFVVPPLQAAHDPFFPYTPWGHYPLPYGPLWPWITAATSSFGGGAVPLTLLAFKALAALAYGACLPVVGWAVAGFSPRRQLTGTCIFAWNPLVLLDIVGNAHNDAVALIPAALGLGLWARHRSVMATLALTASFLVKATVLVALPALLWPSFRRALPSSLPGSRRLLWWVLAHVGPAAALCVVAWLPFWSGGTVSFLRETDQQYQSLTALLMTPVPQAWKGAALRLVQLALLAGFVWYYVRQLRAVGSEDRPALQAIWRIAVVYFLVVAPFYSSWYMVWPILFAAILAERRTTILTALLCLGSLATYLVQFVIVPAAGPSLGWAQTNFLAIVAAFGPFAVGWAFLSYRGRIHAPTGA